jgi:hypothetical protein
MPCPGPTTSSFPSYALSDGPSSEAFRVRKLDLRELDELVNVQLFVLEIACPNSVFKEE